MNMFMLVTNSAFLEDNLDQHKVIVMAKNLALDSRFDIFDFNDVAKKKVRALHD